jgi:hypothetical protein
MPKKMTWGLQLDAHPKRIKKEACMSIQTILLIVLLIVMLL